jgi:16S rRNA processing protein RimM
MAEQPGIVVGRVLSPHGLRGEVKVEPLTDFPERFERDSRLWLDGVERKVERGRPQGRSIILKLEGIDDRAKAESLRGHDLTVPEVAELPSEEGLYYLHDIIGLRVLDRHGADVGRVADVLMTGSNDVYVIEGERGELLLPALDDVVLEVDVGEGRILVDPPDGLEWQRAPPPRRTGRHRRPPDKTRKT